MDLTLLNTLKEKVITEKNLQTPWTYFFDHFGENDKFLDLGFKTENELLETVIKSIGKQLFKENVGLSHLMLTEIPEYYFIHGACLIEGRLANVLLFTDIDKGLLSVAKSPAPGEIICIRFSCAETGKGDLPFPIFPERN